MLTIWDWMLLLMVVTGLAYSLLASIVWVKRGDRIDGLLAGALFANGMVHLVGAYALWSALW